MHRGLRSLLTSAALGALLALPLSGCAADPQRRPMVRTVSNISVAETVAQVRGTGKTAAIVQGDVALVAIQLDSPVPGGSDGRALTENLVGGPVGRPSQGPHSQPMPTYNPGGSPAMLGGTINRGGAAPGGTPNSTQAAPNGRGGLATTDGVSVPAPGTAMVQTSTLDIFNRAADRVLTVHPEIREVRFALIPTDAIRVREIATALGQGQPVDGFNPEIDAITQRAYPAGTSIQRGVHPPQGGDVIHDR